MITDWQLSPTPPAEPDTGGERSEVLVRLLEEVERRDDEDRQAVARRPAPSSTPPRPFAYD
jgi:hypothetical protein